MSTLNLPCWNLSPLFLIWSITGTQNISFPSLQQPFNHLSHLSIYNSNLPLTQELQFLPSLQGFFSKISTHSCCIPLLLPSGSFWRHSTSHWNVIPHVPREAVLPLPLSDCSLFNTLIKFTLWPHPFLQRETHTPVLGYRAALAKIKKLSNLDRKSVV